MSMKKSPLVLPKIDLRNYSPKGIPAIDQVRVMEDSAFEDFIVEWLYVAKKQKYTIIEGIGGAGDKGRDVIGTYYNGDVDYYQCKHYQVPLSPSMFTVELGKLCYYTFQKELPIPKHYYIIASNGIGPTLKDLLDNPAKLNLELINNWDTRCKDKIGFTNIPLDPSFSNYIHHFDFSIIKNYPIQKVINEHLPTKYGSLRFGTASVDRPSTLNLPPIVESHERRYILELFKIYSEEVGKPICSLDDLKQFSKWFSHLERQRKSYFSVEAIRRELRDSFTDDDEFKVFTDEVYDGIIDAYDVSYESGFKRLTAVLLQASSMAIQRSLLASKLNWIGPNEKKGACHILINEARLEGWI